MPKVFDLLKLYLTNAHLTDQQQTQLIIDLILALVIINVVAWITEYIIQFKLKQKDVQVELQKQHGARRSEICEELWRQMSEINQILPGEPDARNRSISMIAAARSHASTYALYLNHALENVISDLLDYLTIAATDYSKKDSAEYLRLRNEFRKEFRKA